MAYTVTVRRVGLQPLTRRQTVGIGQTIQLDLRLDDAATQLSAVNVAATRGSRPGPPKWRPMCRRGRSTPCRPAIATSSVWRASPRVSASREKARKERPRPFGPGALDASSINVFIDGASQKNDITGSGISGQDASRGNPFPQNAVQEFRVVTQNFKAEYQKASSAIIVATSKSGSNQWQGSAFANYVNDGFVALDSFQRRNRASNPSTFTQQTTAATSWVPPSAGRSSETSCSSSDHTRETIRTAARMSSSIRYRPPVPAEIAARFANNTGSYQSPFRSNLALVKLNYTASENTSYEVSSNGRFETGHTELRWADEHRVGGECPQQDAGYAGQAQLGQGRDAQRNARQPFAMNWSPTPQRSNLVGLDYQGVGRLGGRDGGQSWVQDRVSIRNDYTYSGLQAAGEHVIKMGGNYDRLNYTASKTLVQPPVYRFNSSEAFAFPREAQYGTGNPDISADNNQVGLYIQDDWSPRSASPSTSGCAGTTNRSSSIVTSSLPRKCAPISTRCCAIALRHRRVLQRWHATQAIPRCRSAAHRRVVRTR